MLRGISVARTGLMDCLVCFFVLASLLNESAGMPLGSSALHGFARQSGEEVERGTDKETKHTGSSSSDVELEVMRLQEQFQGLDERFAFAARAYLEAAKNSKGPPASGAQKVQAAIEEARKKAAAQAAKERPIHGKSKSKPKTYMLRESTEATALEGNKVALPPGAQKVQAAIEEARKKAAAKAAKERPLQVKSKSRPKTYMVRESTVTTAREGSKNDIEAALEKVKRTAATKAALKLSQKRKSLMRKLPQSALVQPHTAAVASVRAPVPKSSLAAGATSNPPVDYGFYLHVFFEAAAVVHQMRQVRKFYPEAPVYVMSDGGANFSGICEQIGNCKFAWRSPAHDCWNPKPFLDRFREGAEWLDSKNAKFTVFLEPDVQLHRRADKPLKAGADAGGLYDMWNPGLPLQLRGKMMEMGRAFSGNKNFTLMWDRFGLAGGSLIRTKAAMIAFKPDHIDWPKMETLWGGDVYSSDVAMLIALSAHGFNYYPWEDVFEGHDEFQPKNGAAFEHCSKNHPGGKPLYGKELAPEDKFLVDAPPVGMHPLKLGECQHCVWADEKECWPKGIVGNIDGDIGCPEDMTEFRKKAWQPEPPRFELFDSKTGAFIDA